MITAEEEQAYFAEAKRNPTLFDVARLILNQGLRPEEAMTVEKRGFNQQKRQITVFQGKSAAARRTLDLIDESFTILERRAGSLSKWFFPSSKRAGEHITKLNCPHDRVLRNIKASWVLHDLRHTFATRMAEAGL